MLRISTLPLIGSSIPEHGGGRDGRGRIVEVEMEVRIPEKRPGEGDEGTHFGVLLQREKQRMVQDQDHRAVLTGGERRGA